MDLKLEFDLIYQKVYRLNESLSPDEFEILKAGFEDGINEGLGKWLGNIAGKVSKGAEDTWTKTNKFAKNVVDKTKDLYKRGKEYASEAWEKLKKWAAETAQTIKDKVDSSIQWVSTNFNLFLEKIAEAYRSLSDSIKKAWDALKDKSSEFLESIKSVFSNIIDSIKNNIKKATEKFFNMKDGLAEWVKTHWTMLKKWVSDTKDSTLSGLSSIFDKVIEAIKNGAKVTAKHAKIIANFVIIKPATMISNFIKNIPALYKEYSAMLRDLIKNEIQDFKLGFEEGAGRPWDRSKGFINKTKYPEMKIEPTPEEPIRANKYKDPFSATVDVSGSLSAEGLALKTDGAPMADVQAAAIKLVTSPEFMKRFSGYNERDLTSTLRRKEFTDKAIEFAIRFWKSTKNKKKRMSIPGSFESFRYIKTFEGFKY